MQARKGRSVHFRSKLPTEFSLSVANSATSLRSHPHYHDQAKEATRLRGSVTAALVAVPALWEKQELWFC